MKGLVVHLSLFHMIPCGGDEVATGLVIGPRKQCHVLAFSDVVPNQEQVRLGGLISPSIGRWAKFNSRSAAIPFILRKSIVVPDKPAGRCHNIGLARAEIAVCAKDMTVLV
jgi:hypothetical protein